MRNNTVSSSPQHTMLLSENVLHISGLVCAVLLSVTVLSFTGTTIFSDTKTKLIPPANYVYDADNDLNTTFVCLIAENMHKIKYEDSPCFNKTSIYPYNPWLRHDLLTRLRNEAEARWKKEEEEAAIALEDNKKEEVKENETRTEEPNGTTKNEPETKKKETEEKTKKEMEIANVMMVGLLVITSLVACWEGLVDKIKRRENDAAKAQERQNTLADFTINRHLRRESQQNQQAGGQLMRQGSLELTAKVTQTLIHQSSLDRTLPKKSSEALRAENLRRNSVPCFLGISNSSLYGGEKGANRSVMGTPAKLVKRQSVDLPSSSEDGLPDSRKKPRHFIRRH